MVAVIKSCFPTRKQCWQSSRTNWLTVCEGLQRFICFAEFQNLARRVNDLLRDKLYHTSAQLAEAMGKLRELEDEKRKVWDRTLESVSRNTQLHNLLASSGVCTITPHSSHELIFANPS